MTDTTPFATSGTFLIGRAQYNGGAVDWWHGAISDVQTYARVLTAAEVGAIYSTTTISATPPAWGVNTLWAAAVDDAGNVSTPMPYSFFTPAPPFTPGVTGDVTGDGKPDLLVREDTGNLGFFGNVLAGVNGDPYSARQLIAGVNGKYTADAYPYLASDQAVYNGDPALWAVAADGTLTEVPVVPGSTQPTLGTPTTISAAGWGKHLQALENNYVPYDNIGVEGGGTFTDSFDGGGNAYSWQALQTAFTAGGGTAALYTDMTGATAAAGLFPDTIVQATDGAIFTWPSQIGGAQDNYAARGQTIPAPLDSSGTPGAVFPVTRPVTRLSLLGSATNVAAGLSGPATVTWSDGTTQTVTITFSDWTLGAGGQSINSADVEIGQTPDEALSTGGTRATTTYLFEDTITLTPPGNNVQLASITLPPASGTLPGIHVFATAAQTP